MRNGTAILSACCALCGIAGFAQAQPLQVARSLFGTQCRAIAPTFDDFNGDGIEDILGYNASQQSVDLLDGLNGLLLRRYTGVVQGLNYPVQLATLPDSDGDGRRETIVIGPTDAWAVRSTAGGGAIASVPTAFAFHSSNISGVAVGPSFTMLVGGDVSQATLVDSATGAIRARISGGSSPGLLGQSAINVGDITGDGIPDFATSGGNVQAPGSVGYVYLLNGATQTPSPNFVPVNTLPSSQNLVGLSGVNFIGAGSAFGQVNTSVNLGDPWPGNGVNESLILSGAPSANNFLGGMAAHVVTSVLNGTITASTVAVFNNTQGATAAGFGECVADVGDVNGDGVRDAAVLESNFRVANQPVGRILIISGAGLLDGYQTSDILQILAGSTQVKFQDWMYDLGDYDHNGSRDLAVSVAFTGFQGHSGIGVQIFSIPAPGPICVFGIALVCGGRRRRSSARTRMSGR